MLSSRMRSSTFFGAACALTMLLSIGHAGAATFSLHGGTSEVLGANFDPSNLAAIEADGIHAGTAITVFGAGTTPSQGLFVSPQNVNLSFQFMGAEAGFTNISAAQFVFTGTEMFNNHTTAPGSATIGDVFDVGSNNGLVPFLFRAVTPGNLDAANGGPIAAGLQMAFAKVSDSVYYAFFDDGGAGPDSDFDDMVVKITASDVNQGNPGETPLPAALPMFAGGLGAMGLLGWRKKRKAVAAA